MVSTRIGSAEQRARPHGQGEHRCHGQRRPGQATSCHGIESVRRRRERARLVIDTTICSHRCSSLDGSSAPRSILSGSRMSYLCRSVRSKKLTESTPGIEQVLA